MSKKRFHEAYATVDMRRRQEYEDSNMLGHSHTDFANMPQQAVIRAYPKVEGYSHEQLEDGLVRVDGQIRADNKKKAHHLHSSK